MSFHNVKFNAVAHGRNVNINPKGLHNLTYILILHPIGGFVALLAFLMGLIGVAAASRFSTIMMAVLSFFAGVITLVVFVIDMVLWNLVKNRLHDAGFSASLVSCTKNKKLCSTDSQGIANWLTVAAFGALVLSFCTSVCGACGRFATGRAAGEKVSERDFVIQRPLANVQY